MPAKRASKPTSWIPKPTYKPEEEGRQPKRGAMVRGRDEEGRPNAIDVHVGNRLRLRRSLLGMTQEVLAKELGLTFQQVQKYERGANRISASRLYDLCRVLGVPVSYFFDDMTPEVEKASPVNMRFGGRAPVTDVDDPAFKRETLELVRNYYRIRDDSARQGLLDLVKQLGRSE